MKLQFIISMKVFIALFCLLGCAMVQTTEEVKTPSQIIMHNNEPAFEFDTFLPLGVASTNNSLAYAKIVNGISKEEQCFKEGKNSIEWETTNPLIINQVQINALEISQSIQKWIIEEFFEGKADNPAFGWNIDIDNFIIRHLPVSEIKIKDVENCFSKKEKKLPAEFRVINTLFGVQKVIVKSNDQIDRKLYNQLRSKGNKKKIRINAVETYNRALDENGKAISKKGRPQFVAPDGTLVPAREVPPPAKKPIFEIVFTIKDTLFFAAGNMPPSYWTLQNEQAKCEVNLIFDDIIPRVPECAEFGEAGFGVSEAQEEDEVVVKISGAGATFEKIMKYNKTDIILAGGRIIAWVTPRQLQEGAVLEIHTLVLNKHPDPDPDELLRFKFGK